jgi:hypothetical protein
VEEESVAHLNEDLSKTRLEEAKAAAGIRSPSVTVLAFGEDVYRFGTSVRSGGGGVVSAARQASGPWWFRSRDWQKILRRFLQGSFNLGTTARLAGAVQWSWSNMDVLLKARVVQEIEAWEGLGLAQYRDVLPNGMTVTLHGFPDVVQLYVPGMPAAAAAFRIVDTLQVASTDPRGNATGGSWGRARG